VQSNLIRFPKLHTDSSTLLNIPGNQSPYSLYFNYPQNFFVKPGFFDIRWINGASTEIAAAAAEDCKINQPKAKKELLF
jgi:hypothetical protein